GPGLRSPSECSIGQKNGLFYLTSELAIDCVRGLDLSRRTVRNDFDGAALWYECDVEMVIASRKEGSQTVGVSSFEQPADLVIDGSQTATRSTCDMTPSPLEVCVT